MPDDPAAPPVRLGLGLAALGRPGYINLGHGQDLPPGHDVQAMREQACSVLDSAHRGGIRHFDAARSYGRAEEFLAGWLGRQAPAPELRVGSKWGYTYAAGWRVQAEQHEVKEHSLANFERQWPQTRSRLGPWLRVYLAHSVTPDSPLLRDLALQERLMRLREVGVTPGLSLSGPQQGEVLERALALRLGGQPVFGAVQATWNLLEPSAAPALAAAHAAGWQVVVKEAVANGRLTSRGGPLPQVVQELSRLHRLSPDALALAAALAQPFASLVLSGASTVAQLDSNLAALKVRLGPGDLDALAGAAQAPGEYWQRRARLDWN